MIVPLRGRVAPRADVIVIGGGVIGCWTAMHLLDRGRRVTLIERDTVGSGASSGNCGYLCPSHVMPLCGPGAIAHALPQLLSRNGALSVPLRWDVPLWRWLVRFGLNCNARHQSHAATARHALLVQSTRLYKEFLPGTQRDCHHRDQGLLMVHRDPRSFDAFAETADRLGTEFDVRPTRLDGHALTKLEPSLVDGLAGGWWFERDSHLDPAALMGELRDQIIAKGGQIIEQTEVHSMTVRDGMCRGLETSAGPMTADQFVVASGAETPRFAKPLGCHIPIVPGKGYSMTFDVGVDSATPRPVTPMIFEDTHVAVTPLGSRLRIGSTMQLMGYDRVIDPARIQMIRDSAATYFRDPPKGEPAQQWVGWRPMVQDDLPCIDQTPAASNAFIASGNGMIGLSTGTGTGQLVAEMMCGEATTIDPAPYSLDRFLPARSRRVRRRDGAASSAQLIYTPQPVSTKPVSTNK